MNIKHAKTGTGSQRDKSVPNEKDISGASLHIKFDQFLKQSSPKKIRVKGKGESHSQEKHPEASKLVIKEQIKKWKNTQRKPFEGAVSVGDTISGFESASNFLPSIMYSSGQMNEEFKAPKDSLHINHVVSNLGQIVENAEKFVAARVQHHTNTSTHKRQKHVLDSVKSLKSS